MDIFKFIEGSDHPPPALNCYEITHRFPKPSTVALIQSFQAEVRQMIHRSRAVVSTEDPDAP